jgi:hypothetical protein
MAGLNLLYCLPEPISRLQECICDRWRLQTSTATQNPSPTYMALTTRAADYVVSELKKKNL